jgi:hypothetical protein
VSGVTRYGFDDEDQDVWGPQPYGAFVSGSDYDALAARLATAEARVRELEPDAERWRWAIAHEGRFNRLLNKWLEACTGTATFIEMIDEARAGHSAGAGQDDAGNPYKYRLTPKEQQP